MRRFASAPLFALLIVLCPAPARAGPINPTAFAKGQTGMLPRPIPGYYEVDSVLSDDELLVELHYRGRTYPAFVVKGLPTKDYADGSKIEFTDTFEVTGTRKLGSRTVWMVERK